MDPFSRLNELASAAVAAAAAARDEAAEHTSSGPASQRRRLDEAGAHLPTRQAAGQPESPRRRGPPLSVLTTRDMRVEHVLPSPTTTLAPATAPDPVSRESRESRKAPFSPRTQEVRDYLIASAPLRRDNPEERLNRAMKANEARPADSKWPDASMRRASRPSVVSAALSAEDANRRSRDIETFIQASAPTDKKDTGAARYRRAMDHNTLLAPVDRWRHADIVRAAGITRAQAAKIDHKTRANERAQAGHDAQLPVVTEIRGLLEAIDVSNPMDRYLHAIKLNEARPADQKWLIRDIEEAVGITGSSRSGRMRYRDAPDSPTTATIRAALDASVGANAPHAERYVKALQLNEQQPLGAELWPDRSMSKAAGIIGNNASDLRFARQPDSPRTRSIREMLDASIPLAGRGSIRQRHDLALATNDQRPADDKWPLRSIRKATRPRPEEAPAAGGNQDEPA